MRSCRPITITIATITTLTLVGCGGAPSAPQATAASSTSTQTTATGIPLKIQTLNASLNQPWGLTFLPDGSMLVTEKAGALKRLNARGETLATLSGLPAVATAGQGGLLDVAVAPDFAQDPWVYWSYAEPGTGNEAGLSGTAVARGRLRGDALTEVTVIFRQQPKVSGGGHFGSRLAFAKDGRLFVTLGERQQDNPASPGVQNAQNLGKHLGKIVRLERNGQAAPDNPALGTNALPDLWSWGHRNPQGAAVHPDTGELWVTEHGPQGGDELNRVLPAQNFGWPITSYGCPYGSPVGEACRVRGGRHAPEFIEPIAYWVPVSQAPSGLTIYSGSGFPEWKGHFFTGALSGKALWRLEIQDGQERARESLLGHLQERIRDVRQGPEGWLYLLTDGGKLVQLSR